MAETVTSIIRTQNGGEYRITHPADYTDEQLRAAAAAYLKQAEPEMRYPAAQLNRPKPESFIQGVVEGAVVPFNNAARALETVAETMGLGGLGALGAQMGLAPNVASAEEYQRAASEASPFQGSAAGQFVGNVVGTLPAAALPGGVMAQGAMGGALMTNARDPIGILMSAGEGAIGAKIGSAVLKGAGALANPKVSDDLRTLARSDVRVTPGQIARASHGRGRSFFAQMEDTGTSLPFVGRRIDAAVEDSLGDFERAAIDRSLEPVGDKLPAGYTGRRAIKYAGDRLSREFDDATASIPRFATDQEFVDDLVALQADVAEMLPERAAQFANIIKGLGRFFGDEGTTLDGAAVKEIDKRLARKIATYGRSADADQQELAGALDVAREALTEMVARANPTQAQRLRDLNKGWKSLTQVEIASGNSRGGISPAGYSQAVKMSSDTVRRRGYARGEALNQDLSDAGSAILPSEVGESGTTTRAQQYQILPLLIGAGMNAAYAGAQKVAPAMARGSYLSPEIRQLLEYAARGAPAVAPTLIQQVSQ